MIPSKQRLVMKKGRFILFEGFDGVGKTTIISELIDKYVFCQIKSPEGVFSLARHYFDDKNVNFQDRFAFYSGVAVKSAIKANELMNSGETVVTNGAS